MSQTRPGPTGPAGPTGPRRIPIPSAPEHAGCAQCPLFGGRRVPAEGDPSTAKYLLIGEAPASEETKLGRPFAGKTGRLLDAALEKAGIERKDCYITNALQCKLPQNKTGASRALVCCRPRLLAELRHCAASSRRLVSVAAMGALARDSLFPGIKSGIIATRGWRTFILRSNQDENLDLDLDLESSNPLLDRIINVYVMAHPAFTMYNPDEWPMLLRDLGRVKRGRLEAPGPFKILRGAGWDSVPTLPRPPSPPYAACVLDTLEELEYFVSSLHRLLPTIAAKYKEVGWGPLFLAYDLETDQVDHQRDRILCMSLAIQGVSDSPGEDLGSTVTWIIPDSVLYQDGREVVTTHWDEATTKRFLSDPRYRSGKYLKPRPEAVELLCRLFSLDTEVVRFVAHNAKFDMRFLRQLGVANVRCDFDSFVAHYALDERPMGHALKPLADDYFDSGDYESELFNYISKRNARYSRIPRGVLYGYNAMDAYLTLKLAKELEDELKREGLYEHPFLEPLMRSLPMLLEAELVGVWVDWDEVDRIDVEEIGPALLESRSRLREISGDPFLNPLSSKKVNDLLYDKLGLPMIHVRTRAAGKRIYARSSQKAVVDGWTKMHALGELDVSDQAWEFVEELVRYRHLRKLRGSYIRKWKAHKGTDGRVHTSFFLSGTVTGRLASKDPPMQTIPSKTKERFGNLVANIHQSAPGYKLLYADYGQAELRALASLSGDEFMLKAFREGKDYHTEVALAAFGPNFTQAERTACKRLTFGWAYGGNAYEIAMQALQFEGDVAKRFADEWNAMFQGVLTWREAQYAEMRTKGYVESLLGRRRRQPLLTRDNYGKAMRIAINAPVQSIVSDLNLLSATELFEMLQRDFVPEELAGYEEPYARVVLLIHDSLVLEVREDKVDETAALIKTVMENVAYRFFPDVSFDVDVKIGTRLGELT